MRSVKQQQDRGRVSVRGAGDQGGQAVGQAVGQGVGQGGCDEVTKVSSVCPQVEVY